MPRQKVEICPESPYHITGRTNNKDWFDLPMPIVWSIMEDYLYFISHAYGVKIHAFVLMNNHFHLIATFPRSNLSEAMNYFMRETSRTIAGLTGRINHIYGARFHRSRIDRYFYYTHAYKYLYRNPVEAGLCKRIEDYPYSTLHGLLGEARLIIPIEEDLMLFNDDVMDNLKWLNTAPSTSNKAVVRAALRKKSFHLAKDPRTREDHSLNFNLY